MVRFSLSELRWLVLAYAAVSALACENLLRLDDLDPGGGSGGTKSLGGEVNGGGGRVGRDSGGGGSGGGAASGGRRGVGGRGPTDSGGANGPGPGTGGSSGADPDGASASGGEGGESSCDELESFDNSARTLECWSVAALKGEEAAFDFDDASGTFSLLPEHGSRWTAENQAALLFREALGNFRLTALVHVYGSRDELLSPTATSHVSGGLLIAPWMAEGEASPEFGYVRLGTARYKEGDIYPVSFYSGAVAWDPLEERHIDSYRKRAAPTSWLEAELRACRFDEELRFAMRSEDSSGAWEGLIVPVVPAFLQGAAKLQVGLFGESDPEDISEALPRIVFDQVEIVALTGRSEFLADCPAPP